jgi:SAM-dependent methyltransferase
VASVDLHPELRSVRETYDLVAADYADLLRDNMAGRPDHRAMLTLFAELVQAGAETRAAGPVADIGCGPGRITPYLAGLGLDVFGIDLSPGMIEVARREHPDLRFEVGTMTALNLETASLAGALGWFSLIHLPEELVPVALAEFRRVLRPGGYLMLAFQEGEQIRHINAAYGHEISIDLHRRTVAGFEPLLSAAGFTMFSSMVVAPVHGERERQAYVIARATATVGEERG